MSVSGCPITDWPSEVGIWEPMLNKVVARVPVNRRIYWNWSSDNQAACDSWRLFAFSEKPMHEKTTKLPQYFAAMEDRALLMAKAAQGNKHRQDRAFRLARAAHIKANRDNFAQIG